MYDINIKNMTVFALPGVWSKKKQMVSLLYLIFHKGFGFGLY
jgi:hypothetical protein